MIRVIVKDRKGRVAPVLTKVRNQSRIQPWIQQDCKHCIAYWKGENTNPRWAHDRWAPFKDIPWEDVEYESSVIKETGSVV
jgi:hypothetical protein